MKKNIIAIILLTVALSLINSGCKKIKDTSDSKSLAESLTPPSTVAMSTPQELSMEAYEKFLKNETKVSFDRFMPKDYADQDLYKKGSEYTLSEVLSIITGRYFENSKNKLVDYLDYGYIDCGKDGVNELVICMNGLDIYCEDDDSTLVYILKYDNEKLFLCYCYETWARSYSTINEYGYYQSGGSNGASNHTTEDGLIDKDGKWQPIVSIESEMDINQLASLDDLRQIPQVAETKEISGTIELDTIYFNKTGDNERLYTFYVYDDKGEPLDDANLYTNSIYKEIFNEASVQFVTPAEVSDMILEKEEKVGATAEIKNGKVITWETLGGNTFSDYVKS